MRLSDHPYERVQVEDQENISQRNYGSRLTGNWVVGLVEKLSDDRLDCRFFIVSKRDRQTLESIVQNEVLFGSEIHSDCWLGYSGLTTLGFRHQTVNHSTNFIDPDTLANTQRIESIWTRLRLKIVKHMKSTPLLESHLAEHWYRLYYKKDDLFKVFLSHINESY